MEPVYIERTETVDAARLKELGLPALIGNANMLRRMSRMVRMGVAAGMLCLDGIPNDAIGAIVTATCLGGLEDTEKFLAEISERNEAGLNPTPFMRSVFNTVGAQIALLKGIKVYNVTYVHRTASFENALYDALMLISEGRRNVLAGAFDEMTPSSVTVKERLGLYRHGRHPGEGASFFLLSDRSSDCLSARPLALLYGVDVFRGSMSEEETRVHMSGFIASHGVPESDVEIIDGSVYRALYGEWGTVSARILSEVAVSMSGRGSRYALLHNCSDGLTHSMILIGKA
ncbi:MAG: beta-ketoacyl synthase chain length factor [Bacteroidetes bacterium]|uniref:Beta-ketoacyl synthase chain length factor n=1 Tax=Candidatus Cryptobacteroides intestinigallinarum TaxID=2840767 RepID=A0A9D9HM41_9BACT|nr:beta-ketoacyl synthase chain length factor [Candidatus Cryptobacteroides intestinigallinarum]